MSHNVFDHMVKGYQVKILHCTVALNNEINPDVKGEPRATNVCSLLLSKLTGENTNVRTQLFYLYPQITRTSD